MLGGYPSLIMKKALFLTSSVTKVKAEKDGEVFMGDKGLQKRDLESVSHGDKWPKEAFPVLQN